MEVKIPIQHLERKLIKIKNTDKFRKDLIEFVDELENKQFLNQPIYDKLIGYGVNQKVLDQMIDRIKIFSSYDDNETNINFPYEDWIPQLTSYYTEDIK